MVAKGLTKNIFPKNDATSESLDNISKFYFKVNSIFSDSKLLQQLILTYPITSNEAERSFSQLKQLLTSQRTSMTDKRVNNLMLMAAHKSRLNEISNDFIITKFNEKPRLVKFRDKAVVVDETD